MRYIAAIVVGALLAALLTGLAGSLGPSGSVHLSRSVPADYLALAGATGLSALAVYGVTAACIWLCLFIAALCSRCRTPAPVRDRAPEPEKEGSWLPS